MANQELDRLKEEKEGDKKKSPKEKNSTQPSKISTKIPAEIPEVSDTATSPVDDTPPPSVYDKEVITHAINLARDEHFKKSTEKT